VRGPRGGYELARERRRITVGEIVRTAMLLSKADPEDLGAHSALLEQVVDPAVRRAGETFLGNLDAISIEQMCETAEKAHVLDDEKVGADWRGRGRGLRQDNADRPDGGARGMSP
jgi:Rrf2 family transcriptional regulator, iron-sulfur cluster assembly transcription factor